MCSILKEVHPVYILGIIILITSGMVVTEIYSRSVFIAIVYPRKYGHGKTWKKANRHYKTNWSFIQRILWIPLFKEYYDFKYKMLAYFSYLGLLISVFTIIAFLLNEFVSTIFSFWGYGFCLVAIVTIIRIVYTEFIARGKVW